MLGWEFPPFITGGLGTACYGLTRALDRREVEVTFVLPRSIDGDHASHVTLVAPGVARPERGAGATAPATGSAAPDLAAPSALPGGASSASEPESVAPAPAAGDGALASFARSSRPAGWLPPRIGVLGEPSLPSVYSAGTCGTQTLHDSWSRALHSEAGPWTGVAELSPELLARLPAFEAAIRSALPEAAHGGSGDHGPGGGHDYSGDLIGAADRYARFVVASCAGLPFDVIHAHDWLTYPAGIAIARITGRPLVVHVHSTEFDRSGLHVNQRIYDIERRGMHAAVRVIAVSMLTKNLCVNRYGVPADRIEVVYNGVDLAPEQVGMEGIRPKDKIVLYFGRITMQKGPEYFIHAAKRVLDVYHDVKFVVAGSGDQAQRMIELAAALGIGHKVLFTGFLRGKDIARVFALADLYVMPSVSEPFGIAPLEAMGHDVPVLISRTSGVSEVLTHALKCDFWDVDDMADKIVAVLRHPPLQRTLVEHGRFEVRKLTWDGAAARCEQVYRTAIAALGRRR